ncbi:MAG: DUF2095 family protein [Methanobacteriota archaeon]
MTERSKDEFKEKNPHISKEFGSKGTFKINAVRSSRMEAEKAAHSEHGYEPTVVDYIRRCATDEQALGIIDYLEDKGEIENDYAKRLRRQLAKRGLGSFGRHREPGDYESAAKG